MNNRLLATSFRNILLAGMYIFGISQFLFYAETIFRNVHYQNMIPFVMLLLLSLSAAIVGSLVFGQAVILFIESKHTEGILATIYSLFWLLLVTIIAVAIFIIIK